jgi:hypothetical protein
VGVTVNNYTAYGIDTEKSWSYNKLRQSISSYSIYLINSHYFRISTGVEQCKAEQVVGD